MSCIASLYCPWKMTNQNQHGTHMTNLSLMIGKCSLDSLHGGSSYITANVGCTNFRYTTNKKATTQRIDSKDKMNRRRQQNSLDCYFKRNPAQRGYMERIIEISAKFARLDSTSKWLADQARMILKKGWFSDLPIQEIHGQINSEKYQQDPSTVIEYWNTRAT